MSTATSTDYCLQTKCSWKMCVFERTPVWLTLCHEDQGSSHHEIPTQIQIRIFLLNFYSNKCQFYNVLSFCVSIKCVIIFNILGSILKFSRINDNLYFPFELKGWGSDPPTWRQSERIHNTGGYKIWIHYFSPLPPQSAVTWGGQCSPCCGAAGSRRHWGPAHNPPPR